MTTDTRTLADVQQRVIEATKECWPCAGTGTTVVGRGGLTGPNIYSYGNVCGPCAGTGRVLRYPKAGEKCEGHWAPVAATTTATIFDKETTAHSELCCNGTGIIPTEDLRRLLEAVFEAGWEVDLWNPEGIRLRLFMQPGIRVHGFGRGADALWYALDATLEAK